MGRRDGGFSRRAFPNLGGVNSRTCLEGFPGAAAAIPPLLFVSERLNLSTQSPISSFPLPSRTLPLFDPLPPITLVLHVRLRLRLRLLLLASAISPVPRLRASRLRFRHRWLPRRDNMLISPVAMLINGRRQRRNVDRCGSAFQIARYRSHDVFEARLQARTRPVYLEPGRNTGVARYDIINKRETD